jgi:hypothetical protein
MPIKADIELDADAKTFASGLLVELIAALRESWAAERLSFKKVCSADRSLHSNPGEREEISLPHQILVTSYEM